MRKAGINQVQSRIEKIMKKLNEIKARITHTVQPDYTYHLFQEGKKMKEFLKAGITRDK